jgi:hypothetical protein
MSASADDAGAATGEAFRRLERAVARALQRVAALEARAADAEARAYALDQVLFEVTGGEIRPTVMLDRMDALRARNEALEARLARGGGGVERLLARIRFLEEQRASAGEEPE